MKEWLVLLQCFLFGFLYPCCCLLFLGLEFFAFGFEEALEVVDLPV